MHPSWHSRSQAGLFHKTRSRTILFGLVRSNVLQGFVGSLVGLGASKGVFVTTSSFSGGAQAYVGPLSQRAILIDGERLTSLMLEDEVGVRVVRKVRLRRLDEDFFADD